LQVYTAVQLKKTIPKTKIMSSTSNSQHFSDQARKNRLVVSPHDAEVAAGMMAETDDIYATIREIDTTGFEPAAIFVPTPSQRESD
jgi:hypothetical protein